MSDAWTGAIVALIAVGLLLLVLLLGTAIQRSNDARCVAHLAPAARTTADSLRVYHICIGEEFPK